MSETSNLETWKKSHIGKDCLLGLESILPPSQEEILCWYPRNERGRGSWIPGKDTVSVVWGVHSPTPLLRWPVLFLMSRRALCVCRRLSNRELWIWPGRHCVAFRSPMSGWLKPCFLPLARGGIHREMQCQRMDGRCEAECLSFEVKIGGCRAELTPFCCKKNKNK